MSVLLAAIVAVADGVDACMVNTDQAAECGPTSLRLQETSSQQLAYALSRNVALIGQASWLAQPETERSVDDLRLRGLYVDYASRTAHFRAGKLDPETGFRWHRSPSAYGGALAAAGYVPKDRLGVALSGAYDAGALGRHRVQGSTFTTDTTPLSRAWIERVQREDEIATDGDKDARIATANAFALDGSAIPGVPGLRYHIGLLRRGPEQSSQRTELGVDTALAYSLHLGEMTVTPVIEHAHFARLGRAAGRNGSFTTGGGEIAWRSLRLSAGYTAARIVAPNGERQSTGGLTVISRIRLAEDLELSGSWRRRYEEGPPVDNGYVGLTYRVQF